MNHKLRKCHLNFSMENLMNYENIFHGSIEI